MPRFAMCRLPGAVLEYEGLYFQPAGGAFRWIAFMAALWLRRQSGNPRASLWRAVLALTLVISAGCSDLARPSEAAPPAAQPPYVSLAANYLRSVLKDRAFYEDFRISPLRWVDSIKGWSWLACVRFQDHGHPRSYAVFIQGSAVVDARYAVETDSCAAQSYTQFDLVSGVLGRPTAPVQPALY